MHNLTEKVLNAFIGGKAVHLGCMSGKEFRDLTKEIRKFKRTKKTA